MLWTVTNLASLLKFNAKYPRDEIYFKTFVRTFFVLYVFGFDYKRLVGDVS